MFKHIKRSIDYFSDLLITVGLKIRKSLVIEVSIWLFIYLAAIALLTINMYIYTGVIITLMYLYQYLVVRHYTSKRLKILKDFLEKTYEKKV